MNASPPLDSLPDRAFSRYSRQIMLSDWGEVGQQRLTKAKVLIVGCGGLGTAAGLYLAGAGVGQLALADDDELELSNLPRQIAYREADLGQSKSQALSQQLKALNCNVHCRAVTRRLDGMALALEVSLADLVLDCSDNMATRQAVNAACQQAGKPLFAGAAIGWQGQLMTFDFAADPSPCYHCLFPQEQALPARNCQSAGVVGPVVGVVGNLQALEALKWLLGQLVAARFHQLDGRSLSLTSSRIAADPTCPVCQPIRHQKKEVSDANLAQ